jgi:hypothetical protein
MGIGDIAGLIVGASISSTWLGTAIAGAIIGCIMAILGYAIAYKQSFLVREEGFPGLVRHLGMGLLIAIPEFTGGCLGVQSRSMMVHP